MSIHNKIRLVQDFLEYCHLIEDKGLILFLDCDKAFDMLEHQFFLKSWTEDLDLNSVT